MMHQNVQTPRRPGSRRATTGRRIQLVSKIKPVVNQTPETPENLETDPIEMINQLQQYITTVEQTRQAKLKELREIRDTLDDNDCINKFLIKEGIFYKMCNISRKAGGLLGVKFDSNTPHVDKNEDTNNDVDKNEKLKTDVRNEDKVRTNEHNIETTHLRKGEDVEEKKSTEGLGQKSEKIKTQKDFLVGRVTRNDDTLNLQHQFETDTRKTQESLASKVIRKHESYIIRTDDETVHLDLHEPNGIKMTVSNHRKLTTNCNKEEAVEDNKADDKVEKNTHANVKKEDKYVKKDQEAVKSQGSKLQKLKLKKRYKMRKTSLLRLQYMQVFPGGQNKPEDNRVEKTKFAVVIDKGKMQQLPDVLQHEDERDIVTAEEMNHAKILKEMFNKKELEYIKAPTEKRRHNTTPRQEKIHYDELENGKVPTENRNHNMKPLQEIFSYEGPDNVKIPTEKKNHKTTPPQEISHDEELENVEALNENRNEKIPHEVPRDLNDFAERKTHPVISFFSDHALRHSRNIRAPPEKPGLSYEEIEEAWNQKISNFSETQMDQSSSIIMF